MTQRTGPRRLQPPAVRARAGVPAFMVALGLCAVVLVPFLVSQTFHHWFVIPLYLCGSLFAADAVEWVRGRLNVFDPAGILGLIGFYCFFVAPLLHVAWDYWLIYVPIPSDLEWREWLGKMAWLNAAGIVIYYAARRLLAGRASTSPSRVAWRIVPSLLYPVLALAMVVSFCLQMMVYARFGGIQGYIEAYERVLEGEVAFGGMGALFILSESFPFFALLGFVVFARGQPWARNWLVVIAVLLAFVVLKQFFGGLRGSRGLVIYSLFWAVGMIHFWIRPIPKGFIAVGLAFSFLFMYGYAFYKSYGSAGFDALQDSGRRAEMTHGSGRSLEMLLLGDLDRSDVQAMILYKYTDPLQSDAYDYSWGRTYVGAAALLIPSWVWPDRPPTKVKEGTDALFGPGAYEQRAVPASNAYGLGGEAIMNFGPVAVPLSFVILAALTVWSRRQILAWDSADSRLLMTPFCVSLCFMVMMWDSDVVLYYIISFGAIPLALIAVCSTRVRRGPAIAPAVAGTTRTTRNGSVPPRRF